MYRLVCFIIVLVAAASAMPRIEECNPAICRLPDCRCSSTDIPGNLPLAEVPQFVHLTFDDAVTTLNIAYYREAFTNRYNPDGCPLAATFYISHEYTYYDRVSNSITFLLIIWN